MIKSSISSYIYGILLLVIAVLGLSLKVVYHQNTTLITDKSRLELTVNSQKDALIICSDGTKALKLRETEITEKAKEEVSKAKEIADSNHKAFLNLLNSKPNPVITKENVVNYGGEDDNAKLRDYINTQYLINQYIDLRTTK